MIRFSAAAVALLLAPLSAQIPPGAAERIERVVLERMEAAGIPGLSVGVSVGEADPWLAGFGFADVENAVPVRPDSVFRFASISKPLTAVAAMALVEQGRLDLDAPIQRYVPSFPAKPWPVTLRQLLSHQSGIRHYKGDEFASTRHYGSVREALAIFADDPLEHEPGTKYLYSTYGFNLAGAAVEAAAGMPYWQWTSQKVIQPAAAGSLRPDHVYQLIPYRVRGYLRSQEGVLMNCGLADTSNKLPGGGWVGTAESLLRVGTSLMQGKLLSPETLKLMWTPVPLKDGKATGYGLGWGVNRIGTETYYEHSGGQQGASTHWIVMPGRRIQVVVLANLESAPAADIARGILAEMFRD